MTGMFPSETLENDKFFMSIRKAEVVGSTPLDVTFLLLENFQKL